jgi:hypothetical protein
LELGEEAKGSLHIQKKGGILRKLDDEINRITETQNKRIKQTIDMINEIESKKFMLNPLMYLNSNELNLYNIMNENILKMKLEGSMLRGYFNKIQKNLKSLYSMKFLERVSRRGLKFQRITLATPK